MNKSVYEDLDDLFKRTLTKEGNRLYYPILLESFTDAEFSIGIMKAVHRS